MNSYHHNPRAPSFHPNRDSRIVRASVLDAALQLGIGGPNSTVADWIFNNPVSEEDEEEVSFKSYPVYGSDYRPLHFTACTSSRARAVHHYLGRIE